MLCPKDNLVCDLKKFDYVEVHTCPECEGVWMEQDTVKSLVTHLTIPGLSTVDEQFKAWEIEAHNGTMPKDFWVEDKLVCSKHNVFLKKHYFAGSDIGVDQCPVCKIFWFDGGELQSVSEMIEDGSKLDLYIKSKNHTTDFKEASNRIGGTLQILSNTAAHQFPPLLFVGMTSAFFIETLLNFVDLRDRMKDW